MSNPLAATLVAISVHLRLLLNWASADTRSFCRMNPCRQTLSIPMSASIIERTWHSLKLYIHAMKISWTLTKSHSFQKLFDIIEREIGIKTDKVLILCFVIIMSSRKILSNDLILIYYCEKEEEY